MKQRGFAEAANDPNSKRFWSMLRPYTPGPPDTITAKEWIDYFSVLFNTPGNFHDDFQNFYMKVDEFVNDAFSLHNTVNMDDVTDIDISVLESEITLEELDCAIKNLKLGKAAGVDGIPADFFKSSCQKFRLILLNFFNGILHSGIFPEDWVKGMIIPLFKKGTPDSVCNYRGITLLPVIGKIFCNVMFKRFNDFVELNSPITEALAGFRKNRSTIDNIYILDTTIWKYLSKHKSRFYCAFIDFEKAFDRIDRNSLFYKLLKRERRVKCL